MADDGGGTSPPPTPASSSESEEEAVIAQTIDGSTLRQRQYNDFARVHGMRLPRDIVLWTQEQKVAFETYQLTAATNFRSEFFDPLAALYEPGLLPPIPTIRPLDNVHKASILVSIDTSFYAYFRVYMYHLRTYCSYLESLKRTRYALVSSMGPRQPYETLCGKLVRIVLSLASSPAVVTRPTSVGQQ
jgi:hypothetical protein